MKNSLLYLLFSLLFFACNSEKETINIDFTTEFEASNGQETSTYDQVILFYKQLADTYMSVAIYEMGKTDSGKLLHLVTFNPNRGFESEFSSRKDKNILLINNGIHPGESDGIDASMMLIRDLAQGKINSPLNTIIAVIPLYNIGGALNRNTSTRTNQNGPKEYGFRGNARNYDLNRDFIKADTKNAQAFIKIFRTLKPELFIDTHVSNGADYQYTLTHLFTQHDKLGGALGDYLHTIFIPALEDSLSQKKWDISPYVNVYNKTPEHGFSQFFDSSRYSTGYAALFNTLGMMVETHMLKPYEKRVQGTYELLKSFINIADNDAKRIKDLSSQAYKNFKTGSNYPITWKIDSSKSSTINFKGYEGSMIASKITSAKRLKYDRNSPFTKEISYNNYYTPSQNISIPEKYIIPQGWWNIINLLKINKIKMDKVDKDTTLTATIYKIKNYKTVTYPYEGHYRHYNTEIDSITEKVLVKKGDYIVNTQQYGVRYILETLEPSAPDSFFNWNYFDAILQQKEGFSPYVWEDMALEFLENNPAIKKEFETKKKEDPNFLGNWYSQLDWIHKKSPNYEKSHLRYPIIRVGG
jgi:hypothetical protein